MRARSCQKLSTRYSNHVVTLPRCTWAAIGRPNAAAHSCGAIAATSRHSFNRRWRIGCLPTDAGGGDHRRCGMVRPRIPADCLPWSCRPDPAAAVPRCCAPPIHPSVGCAARYGTRQHIIDCLLVRDHSLLVVAVMWRMQVLLVCQR